jgi:hexosaminidase
MIDTARHYLPIESVRKVIDSLPMNKFNVLHWHTVDAESFPLKSPSEPLMVNGAYSPTSIYTMDNLKDLTAYARERGVEIIFELDVPGHAAGWIKGKPELIADCMTKYTNINNYALNPSLEDTYTTIQGILGDIVNATGVNRLHIGGDEVIFGCWSNDASITQFMKDNNIATYADLLSYFVNRADGIVKGLGASVTHWEEVFTNGCKVAADTTFQVWTDSSIVSQITAANFNVIASPSNYWYLNIQTNTWQVMYGYEPTTGIPTAQQKLIIGGEVALWGEFVDEVNLLSSLYPRASAVAERLWSQSYVTDQTSFKDRLMSHRCRLIARGIASAPVAPSFCTIQYV